MCFREDLKTYWQLIEKIHKGNFKVTLKEYMILKENHYPHLKWVIVEEYVPH
jgi:hypothetical protein